MDASGSQRGQAVGVASAKARCWHLVRPTTSIQFEQQDAECVDIGGLALPSLQEHLRCHVREGPLVGRTDVGLLVFHLLRESKIRDLGHHAPGVTGAALEEHIAGLEAGGKEPR